jgi:D-alanine--poly(phosphoribitol) ligase subunit 1|tara:strand:- start:1413 stop:2906 length:1494 start_codon:yes stop_codon:yes gene_type:complete
MIKKFSPIDSLKINSVKYKNYIAVETDNKKYSYKEFWIAIRFIASMLLKIKKKPLVVIIGEKGFLTYASMFGVLLAGGTYVPISINTPLKRICKIISLLKSNMIICPDKYKFYLKKKFYKANIFSEKNISLKKKVGISFNKIQISRLAYIIFTSGSTGTPKGVCISREALNHYTKWLTKKLKMKPGKKCSQFSEIGFDLSVADIFGTFYSGATLIPAISKYANIFPGRFIKEKKITHLVCVPSLIDVMNNAKDLKKNNLKSLEKIFFCGEPLLKSQVSSLFKAKKTLEIFNAYGPTEATVSCTYKKLSFSNFKKFSLTSMSVGKAIPGMKIQLQKKKHSLNENEGEILISGIQLADGYFENKKDIGKFFFHKNRKLYRTGDYAIKRKGEIYFKNRIDSQVKIKGHRIELDEIDYSLREIGYKNVSTVVAKSNIITFITNTKKINSCKINKKLSYSLPEYMLPSYFVRIKHLPINANGKINKKQLTKNAAKMLSKNEK